MKTKFYSPVAIMFVVVLFTAGCKQELALKSKLEPEEKVGGGDAVFVDGGMAGRVTKITSEDGARIVSFVITDQTISKEKMMAGVVRVQHDGEIDLLTDGVNSASPHLSNGDFIPLVSKTGLAARKLFSREGVMVVLTWLSIAFFALLLLRKLIRVWLLLLTLSLSSWLAWIALPWTSFAVNQALLMVERVKMPATSSSGVLGANSGAGVRDSIYSAHDLQTVAYAAGCLFSFFILSLILGIAMSRFERPNKA